MAFLPSLEVVGEQAFFIQKSEAPVFRVRAGTTGALLIERLLAVRRNR